MASLTDARLAETRLGGTGRTVARIGLGAMHLSLPGRPEREAAKAVVRRAVELGVTLIDTADAYCIDQAEAGHNEGLVAEALREMGAGFGGVGPAGSPRVVVATKGGMVRPGGRWERDGRPVHLRGACEASLRTLGVERIDLYQFHAPDRAVPFSDSVGAIARLVEEGRSMRPACPT
jgi:aryl-alcohol dehydrogenase-like predicted oxidoreductase